LSRLEITVCDFKALHLAELPEPRQRRLRLREQVSAGVHVAAASSVRTVKRGPGDLACRW
jgi:hypothetical protein